MVAHPTELQRAVADAVTLVNRHPGQASVVLRFKGEDPEIDFVPNSAALEGGRFVFQAGFETFRGSVEELADIRAQVIQ